LSDLHFLLGRVINFSSFRILAVWRTWWRKVEEEIGGRSAWIKAVERKHPARILNSMIQSAGWSWERLAREQRVNSRTMRKFKSGKRSYSKEQFDEALRILAPRVAENMLTRGTYKFSAMTTFIDAATLAGDYREVSWVVLQLQILTSYLEVTGQVPTDEAFRRFSTAWLSGGTPSVLSFQKYVSSRLDGVLSVSWPRPGRTLRSLKAGDSSSATDGANKKEEPPDVRTEDVS